MRIAQIAPLGLSLPPKKYGGTERIIHTLTEELVKRGHEVTLFASGDSTTSARLVSITPQALPSREEAELKNKPFDIYEHQAMNVLNVYKAYKMRSQFDIIHDHTTQNYPVSLSLAESSSTPVVITLHGAFTPSTTRLFSTFSKPNYVTISKAQARPAPQLNYAGTVYHGLDMQGYPFSKTNDGYLLYVGRISVEKGVHHAIKVAQTLDLPLIIAGGPDLNYKNYMKSKILPHIGKKIMWVGEVDEGERNNLMKNALCLLHPITWPEPFGLTMIEAMACGCPVVGFNNGSVPEIVKDRISGFVVNSLNEMIQAVKQVHTVKRKVCREYVLARFTAERMAENYEKIYRNVIADKSSQVQIPQLSQDSKVQDIRNFVFSPDFS